MIVRDLEELLDSIEPAMSPEEVAKALKTAQWERVGGARMCEIGPWRFFHHDDGRMSGAEGDFGVKAIFASPEDAATWAGHYWDAEEKFRNGVCDYVPARH